MNTPLTTFILVNVLSVTTCFPLGNLLQDLGGSHTQPSPSVYRGLMVVPNRRNEPPAFAMIRNFVSSLPALANPFNYIPNDIFPSAGGYVPAQAAPFIGSPAAFGAYPPFGGGYGPQQFPPQAFGNNALRPFTLNGMGYSGPYRPSGYGVPSPAYGGVVSTAGQTAPGTGAASGPGNTITNHIPGTVPVVTTRLKGSGTGADFQNSMRSTNDGNFASVAVQGNPDGKPVFRSQTVRGPGDSYGTAYAFSSG